MKKLMERMKKNNKKGFTLVELICVVVLLAILAMVAIPAYSKVQDAAANRVAGSNARTNYSIGKANDAIKISGVTDTESFIAGTASGYTDPEYNTDGTIKTDGIGYWSGVINGKTWYASYTPGTDGLKVSITKGDTQCP